MLSYKQYKLINESVPSTTLGLGKLPTVGGIVTNSGLSASQTLADLIDEAKKKKKMLSDEVPVEDEESEDEDDAETGDGEVVEPKSEKDVPVEDDEEEDDEEEEVPEDDEEEVPEDKEKLTPMMMKKKMKKKMEKMKAKMKKEWNIDEGKKDKKEEKKEKCTKMMTKEDLEIADSLRKMFKVETSNKKHWDGIPFGEETLLPPSAEDVAQFQAPKQKWWDGFTPIDSVEQAVRTEE